MPFQTSLFFNISTKRFVLSPTSPVDLPNLSWVYSDTKNLLIQFVKNQDFPGRVSILPSAGIGLQVIIGPPGGTSYVSATAGTAVGDAYPVTLPIAGGTMAADLGAKLYIDTTLELKTTSAGLYERYQVDLRILNRVATDTLPDPPAADPAMGRADATATFWPRDSQPGDYFLMRSKNTGLIRKIYLDDDGSLKASPLA